jgi:hypothetical protein
VGLFLKLVGKHPHEQVLLRPEARSSTELLDPERTQSLDPESGEGVELLGSIGLTLAHRLLRSD